MMSADSDGHFDESASKGFIGRNSSKTHSKKKVTTGTSARTWKCLRCAVCEICGLENDEDLLVLCDKCHTSYHIYCVEPELESVPQGYWRCKRCVQCITCGATEPGVNSNWMKNYTECGPCSSEHICPICRLRYVENDVIICCNNCKRWLHVSCDWLKSKSDIEEYICILCTSKKTNISNLESSKPTLPLCKPLNSVSLEKVPEMTEDESKRYPVSGEISLTFTSVKNENSEKVNGKKSPSKAVNENDSNLENFSVGRKLFESLKSSIYRFNTSDSEEDCSLNSHEIALTERITFPRVNSSPKSAEEVQVEKETQTKTKDVKNLKAVKPEMIIGAQDDKNDVNQKGEDFIENSRQTEISKYTKKVFKDPLTSVDTNILVAKKNPSKSRGKYSTIEALKLNKLKISSLDTQLATSPNNSDDDSCQPASTTSCRSSSSIQSKNSSIDNICLASCAVTRKSASSQRAEEDELRGNYSIIPMVLFANITHPDLKTLYPIWKNRYTQIRKRWRSLSLKEKEPFLKQAKENRLLLNSRSSHQQHRSVQRLLILHQNYPREDKQLEGERTKVQKQQQVQEWQEKQRKQLEIQEQQQSPSNMPVKCLNENQSTEITPLQNVSEALCTEQIKADQTDKPEEIPENMTTDVNQLANAVVGIEDLSEINNFFDSLMKDDLLAEIVDFDYFQDVNLDLSNLTIEEEINISEDFVNNTIESAKTENEKEVNENNLQDNESDLISKFSKINFGTNETPIKADNKSVDEEIQQIPIHDKREESFRAEKNYLVKDEIMDMLPLLSDADYEVVEANVLSSPIMNNLVLPSPEHKAVCETPEDDITKEDSPDRSTYEHWLIKQHIIFEERGKHYQKDINELRKCRKTLKNQVHELRRRGIKPTGNEVQEIERLSSGIAVLKKENYKNMKLSKQHDDRIQIYKNEHPDFSFAFVEDDDIFASDDISANDKNLSAIVVSGSELHKRINPVQKCQQEKPMVATVSSSVPGVNKSLQQVEHVSLSNTNREIENKALLSVAPVNSEVKVVDTRQKISESSESVSSLTMQKTYRKSNSIALQSSASKTEHTDISFCSPSIKYVSILNNKSSADESISSVNVPSRMEECSQEKSQKQNVRRDQKNSKKYSSLKEEPIQQIQIGSRLDDAYYLQQGRQSVAHKTFQNSLVQASTCAPSSPYSLKPRLDVLTSSNSKKPSACSVSLCDASSAPVSSTSVFHFKSLDPLPSKEFLNNVNTSNVAENATATANKSIFHFGNSSPSSSEKLPDRSSIAFGKNENLQTGNITSSVCVVKRNTKPRYSTQSRMKFDQQESHPGYSNNTNNRNSGGGNG